MQANGKKIEARCIEEHRIAKECQSLSLNQQLSAALEALLADWGHYMRASGPRPRACAGWAAIYVANRNAEDFQRMPAHERTQQMAFAAEAVQRGQRAELVERAWRSIGDYQLRQLLKLRYVDNRDLSYARLRLRLKGRDVPLFLFRAKLALQKNLEVLKKQVV